MLLPPQLTEMIPEPVSPDKPLLLEIASAMHLSQWGRRWLIQWALQSSKKVLVGVETAVPRGNTGTISLLEIQPPELKLDFCKGVLNKQFF